MTLIKRIYADKSKRNEMVNGHLALRAVINGHLEVMIWDLKSEKRLIFFAPFRVLGHTKKIKSPDN
jgi:hypothetical protein